MLITPDWPAPGNIRAFSTTREGGVSTGSFESMNLSLHCADNPHSVVANRLRLREAAQLPAKPNWLRQQHGSQVVMAEHVSRPVPADSIVARSKGVVCAVISADCLPILVCSASGDEVAAIHAGWQGLAKGVIGACVRALKTAPQDLLAWIGPGIGAEHYEVDAKVRRAFAVPESVLSHSFHPSGAGHWQADLVALAVYFLEECGVQQIVCSDLCTFDDEQRFFSFRRDGVTGRMASIIWME